MKAIKIQNNDEARDRETHITFFMVPLPHTFEVALGRLGYEYHREWLGPKERELQEKIVEAITKTCTHILAHRDGYRNAQLPSMVVENLLWEDLVGFMRPDTAGIDVNEEALHCRFFSRSPETELYSEFNDWVLLLHTHQHQAILQSLSLHEDGDEHVLYDVHSTLRPDERAIEFRASIMGDWDKLLERMSSDIDEWLKLENPPTQMQRRGHFRAISEGYVVKDIEAAERKIAAGRFPGPGRPRRPAN